MRPGHRVGQHRIRPDVIDWPEVLTTQARLAGKWVPAVLVMLSAGPCRYTDLFDAIGHGLSDKVLTDTLVRMQATGLITHRLIDNGRRNVVYALTPQGYSLLDPVAALIRWAKTHGAETPPADTDQPRSP
jgi:DNA-binding HxlR family transcriptional regulator